MTCRNVKQVLFRWTANHQKVVRKEHNMSNYYGAPNDFRQYLRGDSLAHFGILGMKWGVRRYQNPDGSLTPEGQRRYKQLDDGSYKKRTNSERKQYDEDLDKKEKEKRDTDLRKQQERAFQRLQNDIKIAENINLNEVRNHFYSDENKDKWEKAVENDEYDRNFLEATQNKYDDFPAEAARKQRLKDYSDYVNAESISKITLDKHEKSQERTEAAELGIKAYNKLTGDDMNPKDNDTKFWYAFEDQTIGDIEVAGLCKQLYDKYGGTPSGSRNAKNEVLGMLKSLSYADTDILRLFKNSSSGQDGLWDLQYFSDYNIGVDPDSYAQRNKRPSGKTVGEEYIDNMFAILQAEGRLNN